MGIAEGGGGCWGCCQGTICVDDDSCTVTGIDGGSGFTGLEYGWVEALMKEWMWELLFQLFNSSKRLPCQKMRTPQKLVNIDLAPNSTF